MALTNRKALRDAAGELLQQNEPRLKKTVLLYSGTVAVFTFAVALINSRISGMIENTSGIGGFQTRTMLETVQLVLELMGSLLPTFWSMGYIYLLLQLSAGQSVEDKMLLQGFREFGPVLRLMLLEGLLIFAVAMVSAFAGAMVLSSTPLIRPVVAAMEPYLQTPTLDVQAEQAMMEAAMGAMTPILIGCAVICLAVLIPVMYRLRMSNYVLMDQPRCSAIYAMTQSNRMTRRHCVKIFLLELSFWWYYLALGAAAVLGQGDIILAQLGVTLPFSGETAYLVFLAVMLVCQFGIQYLALNKVELTFVQAYRELKQELTTPAQVFPKMPPRNDSFE